MYKAIMLLLLIITGNCHADYFVPKSTYEMARATDDLGNVYQLYENKPFDTFVESHPFCAGRKHMQFTNVVLEIQSLGCWWNIGEQVYTYDISNGTKKIPMGRLVANKNFTGKPATGF